MKRTVAFLAVGCLTVGMMALLGSAQMDKSKRPSPPAKATCDLGGGKTITTDYSSPRLKGRKMIGGVEPYGKVWRNGANEATKIGRASCRERVKIAEGEVASKKKKKKKSKRS